MGVSRGYKNTMAKIEVVGMPKFPAWFGWCPGIQSHCASLNRKAPEFYKFEVDEEYAELGYAWPSKVSAEVWGQDNVRASTVC